MHDVTFLDELQRFVRRSLERGLPFPPIERIFPERDYKERVRALLAASFTRAQQRPLTPNVIEGLDIRPPAPEALKKQAAETWLIRPTGWQLLSLLSFHLFDESVTASAGEARRLLDRVLEQRISASFSLPIPEIDEPADLSAWISRCEENADRPWQDHIAYSEVLGLTQAGMTTPLGRVLTQLRGRDSVRWLLTLEILQSTGPADPWRLSSTTASDLLAEPKRLITADYWSPHERNEVDFPHSWAVLARLREFGALRFFPDPAEHGYELYPEGRDLLQEISAPDSRFVGVARALVEEGTAAAIAKDAFAQNIEKRAAAWVVRSVAHALRNALTPADFAIGELEKVIQCDSDRAAFEKYGPRVRAGIERAFKTISDLIALYESANSPAEDFDVRAAVLDAIRDANGAGIHHSLEKAASVTVRGNRMRFVHGVIEIIRNARHMGAKNILVTADRDNEGVLVSVDDDGPGIAPELRQRVFERGFSTRPDGSGQGLALVREVVEVEHGGQITIDRASLGGARFVIRLPRR